LKLQNKVDAKRNQDLGLGNLFVKVPRPGDGQGTFSGFESSYHL